jgi:Family of unknown function (DUF5335)
MPTREIAPESWREFFDSFSRIHDGWLATVEVLGRLGAQVEAEDLPLRGVTADREGNGTAITILLGDPDGEVTHRVNHPTHVRLEQTEEGADVALQIESEEGETTLLRFRSAVLPEMVDGMLPER